MSYNRGMLNKRVVVMNRTAAVDTDYGRKGGDFAVAGTIWAGVTFNRGAKSMREGALDAYDTIMVRSDCHRFLKRDSRLAYDGRTWQIDSFNEDTELDECQITATEVQK